MSKVKKKCCRSTPKRCKNCPVVALRLRKLDAKTMSGKQYSRAVKAARAYP